MVCGQPRRLPADQPRGRSAAQYAADEIDAVAAYCHELGAVYLVPARGGRRPVRAFTSRLRRPKNGQRAAINWAADILLSGAIAQLGERPPGRRRSGVRAPLSSTPDQRERRGHRRRPPVPQPLRLLDGTRRRRRRDPDHPPRPPLRPPRPSGSAARHHRYRSGSRARSGPGGASSRYCSYFALSASSPAAPSSSSRIDTAPEHLHPGQLVPVVRVAIHRQRRPRVPPQEPQPRRLPRPLRLLIDRTPDPPLGHRKGHRQHPRRPLLIEQSQPRHPRRLQQLVCPRNYLGRFTGQARNCTVGRRKEPMELGIGLPNAVPGTTGEQLTDWARAAEEAGFNSLGTIDRIVYRELRAHRRTLRRGGRDRAHPPRHRRHARPAPPEPRDGRQAGPLPRRARRRRPRRPRHRPRRPRGRLRGQRPRHVHPQASGSTTALPKIRAILERRRRSRVQGRPAAPGRRPHPPGRRRRAGRPSTAPPSTATAGRRAAPAPDQFKERRRQPRGGVEEGGSRRQALRSMALIYFSLGPDAQKNAEHDLGDYYAWLGEETVRADRRLAPPRTPTASRQYITAFEGRRLRRADLLPGRLGSRPGRPSSPRPPACDPSRL